MLVFIKKILSLVYKKKFYIFLTSVLTLFFVLKFLPYNRVNKIIESNISKATNGKIKLRSEALDFVIWPLGFQFSKTYLIYNNKKIPIKTVNLSIDFLELITLKPNIKIFAEGLFLSSLTLVFKKSFSQNTLDIKLRNLDLQQLSHNKIIPLNLSGKMKLDSKLNLKNSIPITGTLNLTSAGRIQLYNSQILTNFGAITIPSMNFKKSLLQLEFSKNKMSLKTLALGDLTDKLFLNANGHMGLNTTKKNGRLQMIPGPYITNVQIRTRNPPPSIQSLLTFFEKFHSKGQYKFRLKGEQWGLPPDILPL